MATEKIANYTAEQVAEMKDAYVKAPTKDTVAALATKFGKSAQSIVAKLAMEKVYVSAAKVAVAKRAATKADMVGDIAKLAGVSYATVESLEKATGPALKAVLAAMADLAAQVVAARVKDAQGE
jgi:hypothetical protein